MQETKLNGIRRILNFISKYELALALSGIFIVSSFYLSFSLSLSASITQLVSKLLEVGGREKDHLLNKNYMTDFFWWVGGGETHS